MYELTGGIGLDAHRGHQQSVELVDALEELPLHWAGLVHAPMGINDRDRPVRRLDSLLLRPSWSCRRTFGFYDILDLSLCFGILARCFLSTLCRLFDGLRLLLGLLQRHC